MREAFARAAAGRIAVAGKRTARSIEDFTLELDFYDAARIIRDMRKAMRRVRDEKSAMLNKAVEDAEGAL